jgi:hypothetical protein
VTIDPMIVYHATASSETLRRILAHGFTDTVVDYGVSMQLPGVWITDRPLMAGDGGLSGSEPLLRVEIPEGVIRDFEWMREGGAYRAWLVPAAVLNRYTPVDVGDALDVLERES